jgi:hypothetical protein
MDAQAKEIKNKVMCEINSFACINTWIDIGIMLIIRIYIFNDQFQDCSHFPFFLFEFEE